ncbi:hypothetical protein CQA38_08240 [Campylobacter sp. MIT 12-5580]|uniref:hypothetical protein n=1 Tax=Campylobacter sp. MIT 12-5580 TaxID=2040651 RepID=UPI0010F95A32|nr:hypothetical protein [Campylobacter sp. MIT 12-5580]TKX28349.1 hypothetical protein CQA38_08240 [Campylobacter sp. MIT 12-5580]
MFKKLILGSVAAAATGYGIKKIYEALNEDDSTTYTSKEEDRQDENELFKELNKALAEVKNAPFAVVEKDFDELDFDFEDEKLSEMVQDLYEFVEQDYEELDELLMTKVDFQSFDEEEKKLFMCLNKANDLLCELGSFDESELERSRLREFSRKLAELEDQG